MDILDVIKKRRSVRKFKRKEIPKDFIEKLKTALIWAPSAGNLESRKFFFVFDENLKKRLALAAFSQSFIKDAPLVVVACADRNIKFHYGERGEELYMICDVSASIQNLLLCAEALGLGACWVGAFDEDEVAKILNLPSNLRPIAIVPIGFPDEKPTPPPRSSKKDIIKEI